MERVMGLPPGLLLSFYGDDFTGSTDTMEALAKAGLRTVLFLAPPRPEQLMQFEGLRAVGVAGVSRSLSPAEMDVELPPLFEGLRDLNAPIFHVKICSTFDSSPLVGSVGHTIDRGQRVFQSPYVPLVVGAPVLNRFCVFGNLFARSGPESDVFRLDRHPTMSRHPVTPMDEGDLRLHLARQTTRPIGLVDVLQLDSGEEQCAAQVEALRQSGHEIILFDTLTPTHLTTIGRLLWERDGGEAENGREADKPLFVVGSSGVEYALTQWWQSQGWLSPPPSFAARPVEQIIVVSGSCSPVTARQIDWAVANGFVDVPLDPIALLEGGFGSAALEAPLRSGLAALRKGHSIVVHTCRGSEDPRLTATKTYFTQTEDYRGERRLGRQLGSVLNALLAVSGVRRVVVAGGDTSGYVAQKLGIEALEMIAPFAPGSPLCRVYAAQPELDGLEILFKGGQVGRVDLFGSILRGTL
jgi:uncharacterized protein YgbK (DUF1537 family)